MRIVKVGNGRSPTAIESSPMDITFPDERPRASFGNNSVEFDAVIDGERRVVNVVPIEVLRMLAKFDTSEPSSDPPRDALALFARYREELRGAARQEIEEGKTNARGVVVIHQHLFPRLL